MVYLNEYYAWTYMVEQLANSDVRFYSLLLFLVQVLAVPVLFHVVVLLIIRRPIRLVLGAVDVYLMRMPWVAN